MTPTVLFCLAYAGGWAASLYGRWPTRLPQTLRVVPLELAGHGRRMGEPFDDDLVSAAADLLRSVRGVAKSQRYAIFGHSMGGMLAYEMVKALEEEGLPSPTALFVSGCKPPHASVRDGDLHRLPDKDLLHEIERLGGTPKEFLECPEWARTFLPILRSDFRLIERYRTHVPAHVMNTELVALHGDRDAIAPGATVREWQRYCATRLRTQAFAGGHFFINEHTDAICRLLAAILQAA